MYISTLDGINSHKSSQHGSPTQAFSRRAVIATIAVGLLAPNSLKAQINNLPDAINRSGRQRMLSQQLAKAWLLILSGVDREGGTKILNSATEAFDKTLLDLKVFAAVTIQKDIISLEGVWSEYKALLLGAPPSADKVPQLIRASDTVLTQSNTITQALESTTNAGKHSRIINIAGRQRMLTQRIARQGFLSVVSRENKGLGAPSPMILTSLVKEFEEAHTILKAYPGNTDTIKGQLQVCESQWAFFKGGLEKNTTPELLRQLSVSSELILKTLDPLVAQYAKLT